MSIGNIPTPLTSMFVSAYNHCMIRPCSSETILGGRCIYEGEIDTDKEAYSVRHLQGKDYYYHYMDYVRHQPYSMTINQHDKKKLATHLLKEWENGNKTNWIVNVLDQLGYKVEE